MVEMSAFPRGCGMTQGALAAEVVGGAVLAVTGLAIGGAYSGVVETGGEPC